MKAVKFRINIDFIINIISAIILVGIGISIIIGCIFGMTKLSDGIDMLSFDNDYETVLSLFIAPFLLVFYAVLFGISIIFGYVPVTIGLIISALSTIARFVHTENGTLITKPYKVLMTISNIITCSTFGTYAFILLYFIIKIALTHT